MRTAVKLIVVAMLGIGLWKIWDLATALFNQPSDEAVIGGIVLVVGALASVIIIWRPLMRALNESVPQDLDSSNLSQLALLALAGLSVFGTSCATVGPGHVGIKINNVGKDRGVEELPLETGRIAFNPITEQVFIYPTYVQTATWAKDMEVDGKHVNEEITFNTKDQVVVGADISLSYQIAPERIPEFYVKFRSDDIHGFTHGFLRNFARDAFNEEAGKYTAEEVNSLRKEEFLEAVRTRLNEDIEPYGIKIEQFGFLNSVRMPEALQESINLKVTATQRAQQRENELREAEAEAAKLVAKAEGEAEANRILAESISPELIQWRTLEIVSTKWNGAYPQVFQGMNGPSSIISIPGLTPPATTPAENK